MTTPRRDRLALFGVPLFFLGLAIALTWPAVTTFNTRLAGDYGDGFQNLWNFWWLKEAVIHGHDPFFTHQLRVPFGVSLVFQTMTWPDAVLALPLWLVLPPLGVYNAAVLWSFVLTGLGMYALVHDASGSRPAALFAGAAFMAIPFHMSHALGHQHLVSIGYLPLYLMFLHRVVKGGTRRDAILGGLSLSAAALCSWYQLLFAFIWSLGVFGYALITQRKAFISARFLKQALTLAISFLIVTGPLLAAMFWQARSAAMVGSHDAHWYSADLESFFYPGARSAWAGMSLRWRHWTGNAAENGDYLGYVLLALGLFGAARVKLARAYLVTGLVGALLSLGPSLHIAGHLTHGDAMPYAALVRLIPALDFSGVPVRFGLLAQGALVIMAGLGLSELIALLGARRGAAITTICTALMLVELWPQALPTSVWPVPAPMAEWARSKESFSVLDLTGDTRMLWDAIHHGKPCVGGYVTRAAKKLDDWQHGYPVLSRLDAKLERFEVRVHREDPRIDFDWGSGRPDPEVMPDLFRVRWQGAFAVPQDGDYRFSLSADDSAALAVDGARVVQGAQTRGWRSGQVHLTAGVHRLEVNLEERSGDASIHTAMEGPGVPRGPIVPVADTAGMPAAFHAELSDVRVDLGTSRVEALAALKKISLRYVVITGNDYARQTLFAGELGLPLIWDAQGVKIYELVPDAPASGISRSSD